MDLYSRPDYYDKICGGSEDIDFYQRLAISLNGPVLELACGTGRVLGSLQQTGLDCVGLDLSESMIASAKKRYPKANFIIGDMRGFELNRQFNLIFIALNSLLHLHSRLDIEQLLCRVKSHLSAGGEFAFSIFNPSAKLLARDARVRYPVSSFVDDQSNETVVVEETSVYEASTQISHLIWYYSTPSKADFHVHPLKMRNIFPQELDELLYYNGFEIIQKNGDHQGSSFRSESMLQVVRCRPKR